MECMYFGKRIYVTSCSPVLYLFFINIIMIFSFKSVCSWGLIYCRIINFSEFIILIFNHIFLYLQALTRANHIISEIRETHMW